ncbi:Ankyrin repeat and protein kinase domain containing protein 1 [Pyrenophora tritici-repentis]|uniref:Arp, Ankyrin repeat protein n=2 Tax=Pyrenophora tritici-repentis TaxID=45151 RepID=A0A2W1FMZ3_9PLEO|nr:Ankyrin repeat and protein kinase domain-containing protein 1 [Pyrenophora tritici-repentis]KAF7454160.1 Ankyrin repeat and protein kinase domain containing protein [Pyrenophora tritici-repentis]KAF7577250.1 Arp, Ankyrin repeat protein [Pyrenophora tritici-repentis]KAG9387908.1 Ankyrin repeat and protein kinase domain containing protein 1 [Pyrenophora tritici-repentis]KAI1674650.1 Ankyrin repeat and protein kinase domain containing protein [Pyrenophora tritici-repentis]
MARSPSRSSDGADSAQSPRVEPRLLKAVEEAKYDETVTIIEHAKAKSQNIDHLLRIGLMRAAERGHVAIAEYFLNSGAKPDGTPDGRLSPLLKAIEKNQVNIVKLLLRLGANADAHDKQGRTALMTAAWKNHFHIMHELLRCGASVNKKDNTGRNVLHNLAADKHCNWGRDVISELLRQNIAIDGPEGQDEQKRTPLHWAASTGKRELCEMLLRRPRLPRANVNAIEVRQKTALHLAVAHGRDDIIEVLLSNGADIMAKSDGSWTPLHNACEQGSVKVLKVLLGAGADINARLLNGMTPLHVAAQAGHVDVVNCLLERKDIKRAAKDTFGITPFLRAAQSKKPARKAIINTLAPHNQVEALSEDALGATRGFHATIVDFGNFHNENKVSRKTVHELLYARDAINPRKPAVAVLPKESKATSFRWIHLPANNMAWVEALLTKAFIEEGAADVEGFKALERSFTHQHRGQQIHSHFMRPLCQSTPRAPRHQDDSDLSDGAEQGLPQITVNKPLGLGIDAVAGAQEPAPSHLPRTPVRSETVSTDQTDWAAGSGSGTLTGREGKTKTKEKTKKAQKWSGSRQAGKRSGGTDTPNRPPPDYHARRTHTSHSLTNSGHLRSPGSPGRKDPTAVAKGNIFAFMPYLHFETNSRRQEMQDAIKTTQTLKERRINDWRTTRQPVKRASTYDEMLLRAHLTSSQVSLHVRRTLDQFFYHNIDTQSRDRDQVVYRYQCKSNEPEHVDPKIFMVDQLWMWTIGKDLIVTAFPQRWQQPRNDPLNVLDGVIEDINSKTRDPVRSVYDLAMIITGRCSGVFDRHRVGDEEYQFLDMFESSIGDATEMETMLFKEFNTASAQASAWLQHHRRPNRFSRHLEAEGRQREHLHRRHAPHHSHAHALIDPPVREQEFDYDDSDRTAAHAPLFVDKLLDIGAETDLLAETKDIRDELNMISKVLEDQRIVLPDMEASIIDIYREEHKSQQDLKKRFRDMLKTIDTHIKDIERMDKQAKRIYESITDLLDLKQKHANAFEARFARDQAAGTARQSQTIMVFTIVTIIFLPLSFIAALFTINIREYPHDPGGDQPSLPLSFVSKYMFGISFAISIPFIAIALSFDAIGDFFREVKRRWRERKARHQQRHHNSNGNDAFININRTEFFDHTVDTRTIEEALSRGRSTAYRTDGRHSIESYLGSLGSARMNSLLPVASRSTGPNPEKGAGNVRVTNTLSGNGNVNGTNGGIAGRLSVDHARNQIPIERISTGFRMRGSGEYART